MVNQKSSLFSNWFQRKSFHHFIMFQAIFKDAQNCFPSKTNFTYYYQVFQPIIWFPSLKKKIDDSIISIKLKHILDSF